MKSTAASKRKRARQTRLNFTPVASSSPAAAHFSPQVRDRASAVAYGGSPSPMKRRKVEVPSGGEVEDITDSFKALPTPDQSSHSKFLGRGTLSRSEQLRRQLDFGDNDKGAAEAASRRGRDKMGATASRQEIPGTFRSSDTENDLSNSSSTSGSEELPSKPLRASARTNTRSRGSTAVQILSDEDEAPAEVKTRRSARKVSKAHPSKIRDSPNQTSSPTVRSSNRSTRNQKPITIPSDENTNSEDLDAVKLRRLVKKPTALEPETELSSDEMPDSSPMKKPRRAINNRPRQRSNSFEVPDDVESEDDDGPVTPLKRSRKSLTKDSTEDSEDFVIPSARKRLRRPPPGQNQSSEEEDEEVIMTTQRRRKAKATEQGFNQQEKEDLDEDLEWLGSSRKLSNKIGGKLATPKKNARQTALEELKRKRAGETVEASGTSSREKPPLRTAGDDDTSSEEEAEEDDGLQDMEVGGPLHRSDVLDMFYENDEDDGFVVDEDENGDDTIGAPDVQLPLEFSGLSRSKPKELFKYAIEWMVHKKINPAFKRDDPVYQLTFQKLDDEVKGLAGSKFVSSVWRPEFTRAIKARPDISLMEMHGISAIMSQDCEACNRRNHPATWSVQLTGKPYHHESLELVAESDEDSDEEDEDDDDDENERDSAGNSLPDAGRWFSLGSTCKQNAEYAHLLHHWRYHLNAWVVDYLVRSGYCTAAKLTERDNMSEKKRRRYAEKIVDDMEEKGEIQTLYRQYRDQLNAAVEVKQDGGWRRKR